MSLLYSPINMSPSNSAIDADEENDFSLTIRGTICVGYQLTIYNNATGASVYTPAKEDISASPLYDNDTLTITVPVSATSGMVNGNQYKWSIDLYYDDTNKITSREVVFNAYTTPTLTLSVASTLAVQSYEFVPIYTQDEDVPVVSFEAKLYDSSGKPQRSSGTIYHANIRYTFDGFQSGNSYSVQFVATNQADVTIESNLESFAISYSQPLLNITPTATNSPNTACVLLDWGGAYQNAGASTGTISYVDNHIGGKFLRLEENSTAYWNVDIPANFTSTFVFAPFEAEVERLYTVDVGLDKLYQLNTTFLTDKTGGGVNTPASQVYGIGGTSDQLYISSLNTLKFYEIDPITLANLSGSGISVPGSGPCGIGGMYTRLFHSDNVADKLYELDPITMANLSGSGVSTPGSDPAGIGGINARLFHCDEGNSKLYEIDPDTLANLSGTGVLINDYVPIDIGGIRERLFCAGNDDYTSTVISEKLYACDIIAQRLYEIDPDTLANLSGSGVDTPDWFPAGIGGNSRTIFLCTGYSDKFFELDIDTLANLSGSGVSTPSGSPTGVGGTEDRLYHCDNYTDKLYEIDPDTLANLSGLGVSSPSTAPSGIGGINNRIYCCDTDSHKLYELDVDTLANLSGSGVSSPSTYPNGIGGMNNRLFHCDADITDKLYEIDPDTLANLSGLGVNAPNTDVSGIGGIKGLSDYLGRFYEIDPDTLTVVDTDGVLSPDLLPSGIGGVKYFEYSGYSLYTIYDQTNSGTSDYLRLAFKTDLINDYFYVQFAGYSVLFKIFDAIDVNDGVYFIAVTPSYISIAQWLYTET